MRFHLYCAYYNYLQYYRIATLLQPIPGYNEQYFSSKPITYDQYRVNRSLYIRIQDWMNNVPHIPDSETRIVSKMFYFIIVF